MHAYIRKYMFIFVCMIVHLSSDIFMYVCMFVCMYVCMYICIYVYVSVCVCVCVCVCARALVVAC